MTDAVSQLFNKIGGGILVTHSHSGGQGWRTAIKNRNVKAIVSYEPGSGFVFPQGQVPDSISYVGGVLRAAGVPMADFMQLTKLPIIIYYGATTFQTSQHKTPDRSSGVRLLLWLRCGEMQ